MMTKLWDNMTALLNFYEKYQGIIHIVMGLALLALAFYLSHSNFQECRAHGFSFRYCITQS